MARKLDKANAASSPFPPQGGRLGWGANEHWKGHLVHGGPGHHNLLLAVALAAYAGVGSLVGEWRRAPDMVLSARYAAYLTPLMLGVSMLVLIAAFVDHDFSLRYVAGNSNRAMDPWLTWVAFYAASRARCSSSPRSSRPPPPSPSASRPTRSAPALPFTTAVLMGVTVFFVAVMMTMANPFFSWRPSRRPTARASTRF